MTLGVTICRAVTLNLFGQEEPLDARMASIVAWLSALEPDVIALQEVRDTPSVPNQARTIAAALGMHCEYAVATRWGEGDEGLALLSRWPLRGAASIALPHATEKERRIVLHAISESPVGPLPLFTTHLNWRMTDGVTREHQVVAVEEMVAAAASADALPRILMGDFNAAPECDEMRFWRGEHSLAGRRVYYQDAWALRHPGEPGITWALRNPLTERMAFLERDRRLDYILVSQRERDGRGQILDARVVLDVAAGGLYPSDHFGVYAEIRLAGSTTRSL